MFGNVCYVIMCFLEVIILEYVEVIFFEFFWVFYVVILLCLSSYCDVMLLEVVLNVLKFIIFFVILSVLDIEGEIFVEILFYEIVM